MIAVILRDLRLRIALLLPIAVVLYALEPGFHQHEEFTTDAIALGPLGVSATLAYLAGLSMMVLLSGFISTDRREGHTRLFFSHPTAPIAYYGLRWGVAYAIAILAAILFLIVGQLIAWGEFLGGWRGLIMPALSAIIYGGLLAFFSAALPRGDGWITFLLFLPTFFPQILTLGLSGASPEVSRGILFALPPQGALQSVWDGLLLESFDWGAAAFAAGYGVIFIALGALVINLREWP